MGKHQEPSWYSHGWNRDLAWKLMLSIVPWVPPVLRPPLHLSFTVICFLAMKNERRASRSNLRRVTGRGGLACAWISFKLFYNFSKFMVAYSELPPYGDGFDEARVEGRAEAKALIDKYLGEGRGLIVLGAHMGQWDVAMIELAKRGAPVTVVMRKEDVDAARFAQAARDAAGLEVVHAGSDPWMLVRILAKLRRNEIVAVQGDRPYGAKTMRAPLFGEAADLPKGPWDLAAVSGAPILPSVAVFEGHRRVRLVFGTPIRIEPGEGGLRDPGEGASAIAREIEGLVRLYPDQWFNFYDVWRTAGGPDAGTPPESRPGRPGMRPPASTAAGSPAGAGHA